MSKWFMFRIFFAGILTALLCSSSYAIVGQSSPVENASVVMVLSSDHGKSASCSAVLVRQDVVLTAAHCVSQPAFMRVHFKNDDGSNALFEINRLIRHPGFRADAVKARKPSIDLALIQTRQPLPNRFSAALLSEAPNDIGAALDIVGYGLAHEQAPLSAGTLRRAHVKLRAPVSNILLWLEGAGAACTGDSGGPVLLHERVVGILAFASGDGRRQCGALSQAIRLDSQRRWIEETLLLWR